MKTAKSTIIKFPHQNAKTPQRIRQADSLKYFNHTQIRMLRRAARDQAELDLKKGKVTGIREWMAIDLLISTGLRVSEAADLKCGDLRFGYGESKIYCQ